MPAVKTSGGGSYKTPVRKPKAQKAPPSSKRRGPPVSKASATPRATKTTGSRSRAPRRAPVSTQAASQVGINAYRDYANSMTNLARTGIRGPGFQMPNLNPFDYLGRGLDALGNAITGGVRNTPNPGANVMSQGERIRDVLNGR